MSFYDAVIGGKSVGVPGTVRLLETAHRQHGRLQVGRAVRAGHRAGRARLRGVAAPARADRGGTPPDAAARARLFLRRRRQAAAGGRRARNPAYAATLRTHRRRRRRCVLSRRDRARHRRHGQRASPPIPGDLTLADLAGYEVKVRAAGLRHVSRLPRLRDAAAVVGRSDGAADAEDPRAVRPAGRWGRRRSGACTSSARPDGSPTPTATSTWPIRRSTRRPPGLLDAAYLRGRSRADQDRREHRSRHAGRRRRNSRRRRRRSRWASDAALEFPSTSHLSIVDRYGNAVAMTTTIEDGFGSRLMTQGGFLLNNELTDFSFAPTDHGKPVANRVEAGKRPRSSMAPTIVYDRFGRVAIVAGSPGGSAIINYVAKTLVGIIDWDLDPQAAIALPNFGSRNGPTELERNTPVVALEPKLRALGAPVLGDRPHQRAARDPAHEGRLDRRRRSAARRHRQGRVTRASAYGHAMARAIAEPLSFGMGNDLDDHSGPAPGRQSPPRSTSTTCWRCRRRTRGCASARRSRPKRSAKYVDGHRLRHGRGVRRPRRRPDARRRRAPRVLGGEVGRTRCFGPAGAAGSRRRRGARRARGRTRAQPQGPPAVHALPGRERDDDPHCAPRRAWMS